MTRLRRLLLLGSAAAVLLLGTGRAVEAQCPFISVRLVGYADERLTVSTTAIPLTVSVYNVSGKVPVMAHVSVISNPINVFDDGTTPTASLGHPVAAASDFYLCGNSIGRFQAIRSGGSDATIQVTYYATP